MEPSTWYEWEKELLVCSRFAFLSPPLPLFQICCTFSSPFPLIRAPIKAEEKQRDLNSPKFPRKRCSCLPCNLAIVEFRDRVSFLSAAFLCLPRFNIWGSPGGGGEKREFWRAFSANLLEKKILCQIFCSENTTIVTFVVRFFSPEKEKNRRNICAERLLPTRIKTNDDTSNNI